MDAVLKMVAKDVRRRLRSPVNLVVMLIFPLAFCAMLGLAFGGFSSDTELPRIRMLLVDEDDGLLSQFFAGATNSDEFNEQFELISVPSRQEAYRMMENSEASALLIIPAGFTEDLLNDRTVTLTLVKNPSQSILPQVVEEMAEVMKVGLDHTVRLFGGSLRLVLETFDGVDSADAFPTDQVLTLLTVELAGKVRPLMHYVFPPAVVLDTVNEKDIPLAPFLEARAGDTAADVRERAAASGLLTAESGAGGGTGFNFFALLLPMVSVMAILFIAENNMRDLLTEQRAGTLTRQFVSPAGVGRVLVAKILTALVICAVAMMVLALAGLSFGWIPPSTSLSGALAQIAAVAFACTGLATLVYGIARTERAGSSFYSAVAMTMSFLGGSFIPFQNMPGAIQRLAPYTINYWGIQGLQELTLNQGGLDEVARAAGILLAFGAVGIAAGWWMLARRFAAGASA